LRKQSHLESDYLLITFWISQEKRITIEVPKKFRGREERKEFREKVRK